MGARIFPALNNTAISSSKATNSSFLISSSFACCAWARRPLFLHIQPSLYRAPEAKTSSITYALPASMRPTSRHAPHTTGRFPTSPRQARPAVSSRATESWHYPEVFVARHRVLSDPIPPAPCTPPLRRSIQPVLYSTHPAPLQC